MFNKAILAVATLAVAQTALATPTPQLAGLPSIVCLTGPLDIAAGLLDSLPLVGTLVSCSSGETCEPLPVPIVGSLLPLGVSAGCGMNQHARLTYMYTPTDLLC